ncbi:MAG TPA: excinuclease ABC subunit UvrC [Verrucomicrobiae bacterium]|nr:excinuclease ABC subunit UvrC [Verrucomicrobiae bacterium]
MNASEKIADFPTSPGVYLMKGEGDTVLYVGKARNLRSRVRSYFGKGSDSRYQIRFLMGRVTDIEYIVTDTEKEALILENTLIKKHRPRYNINLRDDKTYFSLRMDMREEFPRISVIRKVKRDGARYFGPYASASAARQVLNELYRIFPLRHYPLETCRRRRRPCLFYEIRQCSAPCHGKIGRDDYLALAEGAALFLEGKRRDVAAVLKRRMNEAAAAERYEEAARFRDLLRSIEVTLEKQKMVLPTGEYDVFGYSRSGSHLEIAILFIRGGSVIGGRNYTVRWELEDAEGVESFLGEYYAAEVYIPAEILIPVELEEGEVLAELLGERRGKKVAVSTPRKGTKAELVRLACTNAETAAAERSKSEKQAEETLDELRRALHLEALPRRIECYDISNIMGTHAVGSRAVFLEGRPDKGEYRRYRIRTVEGSDDFAMMHEVLSRRFSGRDGERPDLIVVDGGIGQLNVLSAVLRDLGVEGVAAASLAKSRVESDHASSEISRSEERVFLPGRKNPVRMRQNSAPLLLLARIRDEAHRFAIGYHQKLRGKQGLQSALDAVPGVGARRRTELLRHFGSVKALRSATLEEVAGVKGMNRKAAEEVLRRLNAGE